MMSESMRGPPNKAVVRSIDASARGASGLDARRAATDTSAVSDDPKSNRASEPRPKTAGAGPEGAARSSGDDRQRRDRGRGPRDGAAREGAAQQRPAGDARPPRTDDRGPRPDRGERGDRGPDRGDRGGFRGRPDDRRGGDRRRNDSSSPLTASLFSAMQDKEMPCRIAGCPNTWTWFAAQQVRGFGQKPPERMCDQHLAQFSELADREVQCRTPGCPNTWTWKRGAQLAELQRHGRLRKPARLCNECLAAERDTRDVEMPCKVEGCRRTWTWTRDAQLRHRLWVLRQRAKARAAERAADAREREAEAELAEAAPAPEGMSQPAAPIEAAPEGMSPAPGVEAAPEGMSAEAGEGGEGVEAVEAVAGQPAAEQPSEGKRKRRRKRKRVKAVPDPEGPPQRMCSPCAQKLGRIAARDVPCKVHGCTRTWTWDRASQLRAWVQSGTDDVDWDPPAPKRMCEVCRDFCRTHPDRAVPCGRPGCENTWTYKTGAQLQAFLAGRQQDPLKLCDECAKGEFAKQAEAAGLPEGAEIMPCVVPACGGTWVYIPGQRLAPLVDGELSPDRMCAKCRRERGFPAPEYDPVALGLTEASPEVEVSPEDTAEPDEEGGDDEFVADEPIAADEPEPAEATGEPDEAADEEGDATLRTAEDDVPSEAEPQ
jgi:hypothetical protein